MYDIHALKKSLSVTFPMEESDSIFGEDSYVPLDISNIEGEKKGETFENDITIVEDSSVDKFQLEGETHGELGQTSRISLTGPICVISLSKKDSLDSGVIEMVEFKVERSGEKNKCIRFTMKEFNLLQKLMNSFSDIRNC